MFRYDSAKQLTIHKEYVMNKLKRLHWIIPLILLALVLAACGSNEVAEPETITVEVPVEVPVTVEVPVEGETVVETVVVEVVATAEPLPPDPITLEQVLTTDIPTLDPALATDTVSVDWIESLFLNLTNYDLDTADIVPEAATSWEISDDGLLYTFNIRTDIPWVNHNPVTGETKQVVDDEGNPRFVTAADFAYGITRACDPNIGSYYSSVIAPIIEGCQALLTYEDPDNIPEEIYNAVSAIAVDDATLEVKLAFPAAYFLSMTPMWTLAATPQWAIEEHGDNWIEAGNIVTNGRFALSEWVHGVRTSAVRNPLMPEDMAGSGNVESIVINNVPDPSTGYSLWLANEIDRIGSIPDAELQGHLEEFPDETDQIPNLSVFYHAFRMTKPPFDDARVRRAFNAAFDRQTFVDTVRQGQGLPAIHFAPPGIFGAPPIDEVGQVFDPEYARAQLAEAGYPDCEGLPQISFMGGTGEANSNWLEFALAQWDEHLGCSPDTFLLQQVPFRERLDATAVDTPDDEAPHMWIGGWGPDYADENNWVGDVLWCTGEPRFKRECNEIDEMIIAAREESDPATRIEMYREIEDAFFGPEGEMPFAPVYMQIAYQARHDWLERTPALFGGQQWYNWTIDQDAKLSAQ
jgi:oligopeptide transport system substrate-binding protein